MASKEDIKLEREYQEALKISASSVSALQADLQKTLDSKKALNAETKAYLKNLQASVGSLDDSKSIAKQILDNEKEIVRYKEGQVNVSKRARDIAISNLQQQNTSLGIYLKQQEAIERVSQKAEKLRDKLGEGVDKLAGYAKDIPFVGGLIGGMANRAAGSLKKTFGESSQKYVVGYSKALKSGSSHLGAMAKGATAAGGSMLKAFMGPQAILLLIIGALAAGFYAIKQFEAGMKAFREETGLVKGQMDGIEKTAASIGQATMHLTGDVAEGAKVVGQMVAGFGSIEKLSNATLMNATKLSLSYGIGADNIAQTNKMFQNMNGLTEEQAQFMTTNVAKFAELNDVSPDQVMKDINESSADMYKYFRGSPNELMKAAVQARKLGTSLKQSAEVSKSLLNFEDSINSELEASAILGRNLNFNEARFKAAKGDTLGAQQAIMKEVGKLGDLTKLNVYQQEALAKATGMPIEDLINQQRIKQKLGKLSDEDAAAAQQLLKSGKDISKMTKDQAKAALEKQKVENKNVEQTKVMENQMKQMMLQLASAFAPLAQDLMKFLNQNMPAIRKFIEGAGQFISGLVSGIQEGFKMIKPFIDQIKKTLGELFGNSGAGDFKETLMQIGKVVGTVLTFGLQLAVRTFASFVEMGAGIWKILKGIFTLDFSMIGEGIQQAFGGLVDWFLRLPSLIIDIFAGLFKDVPWIQDLASGFDGIVEYIKSLPSKIWESFSAMGGKIKDWFTGLVPGWAKKMFGIEDDGGSSLQQGGSVNDGVIQNGKVISTNPEDTIIAMKKPGGLADGVVSKSSEVINSVSTQEEGSVMGGFLGKFSEILQAPLRGISSIVSGSAGEGGFGGLDMETLQNTILKVSSESIETKLNDFGLYTTEAVTALGEAMTTLNKTLETTSTENTKKMIEKLEEVRKAVIVGALIEMDGDILTRNLAGKQEAFNRVNFASRLKS